MTTLKQNLPVFKLMGHDTFELDIDDLQGCWTEEQYLRLSNKTNRLIEFSDGIIEVLSIPNRKHQAISGFLFLALLAFVQQLGGTVFFAPLRLQIRPGKYREPDLMLLLDRHDPRNQHDFWYGADLVIEIVSPGDASRDTLIKPRDYAEAGIPEYWIVDPQQQTITVLTLVEGSYMQHGLFQRGDTLSSRLMPDFSLNVDAVLDAE